MTVYERQNTILNFLMQQHFSTIKELSKIVWTSESSIRRDIKILESKGFIKQFYGGVILSGYENSVVPVALRNNHNSSVKDELAKQAAMHLFDGATVFMDGSSTVRRIIKYIYGFRRIKIITNNHLIFNETISPEIQLYCTGGRFVPENNIFVGSVAENFLKGITADLMFFSSQAISKTGEISDASEEETSLRKIMLSRAKKKIFLCDSSKIGLSYTFTVCNKDEVDEIICDKKLPWE
jgi:DeoR/GlpR family transcriptional regulator of sugar metabolism